MVEQAKSGTSGPSTSTSSVVSQVEAPSFSLIDRFRKRLPSLTLPDSGSRIILRTIAALLAVAGGNGASAAAQMQQNLPRPNPEAQVQMAGTDQMPSQQAYDALTGQVNTVAQREQAPNVEVRSLLDFDPVRLLPRSADNSSIGIIGTETEYHVAVGSVDPTTGNYSLEAKWQLAFKATGIAVSASNPNIQVVIGNDFADRWKGMIAYTHDGGKSQKTIAVNGSILNIAQVTPDNEKAYIAKSSSDGANDAAPKMLLLNIATGAIREFPIEGLGDFNGIWSMSTLRALPDGSFEAEALASSNLINLKLTSNNAVARILDSTRYLRGEISEGVDSHGRRGVFVMEDYIWTSGQTQGSRGRVVGYFFNSNGTIVETRLYQPDLNLLTHRWGDPYPYVSTIKNGTITMGLIVTLNNISYPEIQEASIDDPSQIRAIPTNQGEWPPEGGDQGIYYLQRIPANYVVGIRGFSSGVYFSNGGEWKRVEAKIPQVLKVPPRVFLPALLNRSG